ncbi:MAG: energy transducer TonB [Cyanobacteria bacterium]|nr:energy transducer TonB [Cyanobacteriota bacterium]
MEWSRNEVRSGVEFLSRPSPRLPRHDGLRAPTMFAGVSALFHLTLAVAVFVVAGIRGAASAAPDTQAAVTPLERRTVVFLVQPLQHGPGGGGGGGGNRQREPAGRAQSRGRDSVTLPAAKPIAPAALPREEPVPPQVVALDAKPLASDSMFQVGLIEGPLRVSPSQGPGSGGGAGDGVGTGIGSGRGPGVGPGTGGGTGGGVYRPGDGASAPTVRLEVRPTYNGEAMRARIQGSVILEAVVQRDGTPRDIRVIRSLDPGGLDRQAVLAAEQWRFNPGRRDGEPVDVLVTIVLDFRIQ